VSNGKKPDVIDLISYLIAAAIVIPIGWWIKSRYGAPVGNGQAQVDWLYSLIGL
jgi:hypothetical protein